MELIDFGGYKLNIRSHSSLSYDLIHDSNIGIRPIQCGDQVHGHPFGVDMFVQSKLRVGAAADIAVQGDVEVGVQVFHGQEMLLDADVQVQFFLDFTHQGLVTCLALLHLAPREFVLVGDVIVLVFVALHTQYPVVHYDHGCHYFDVFHTLNYKMSCLPTLTGFTRVRFRLRESNLFKYRLTGSVPDRPGTHSNRRYTSVVRGPSPLPVSTILELTKLHIPFIITYYLVNYFTSPDGFAFNLVPAACPPTASHPTSFLQPVPPTASLTTSFLLHVLRRLRYKPRSCYLPKPSLNAIVVSRRLRIQPRSCYLSCDGFAINLVPATCRSRR